MTLLPTTSGLPAIAFLEREVAIEDAGLAAAALEPGQDRVALLRRSAARARPRDAPAGDASAMSGTMVGSIVLQPASAASDQTANPRSIAPGPVDRFRRLRQNMVTCSPAPVRTFASIVIVARSIVGGRRTRTSVGHCLNGLFAVHDGRHCRQTLAARINQAASGSARKFPAGWIDAPPAPPERWAIRRRSRFIEPRTPPESPPNVHRSPERVRAPLRRRCRSPAAPRSWRRPRALSPACAAAPDAGQGPRVVDKTERGIRRAQLLRGLIAGHPRERRGDVRVDLVRGSRRGRHCFQSPVARPSQALPETARKNRPTRARSGSRSAPGRRRAVANAPYGQIVGCASPTAGARRLCPRTAAAARSSSRPSHRTGLPSGRARGRCGRVRSALRDSRRARPSRRRCRRPKPDAARAGRVPGIIARPLSACTSRS